jgi:hypothetical protein
MSSIRRARTGVRVRPALLLLTTVLTLVGLAYLAYVGLDAQAYAQMESVTRGPDVPTGELTAGRRLVQGFRANEDNLARIDLLPATYGRVNQGTVVFHLREQPGGPDLRTVRMDAARVPDYGIIAVTFEPVEDSDGKEYYLVIESPDARPGNAITFWARSCDCFLSGELVAEHAPEEAADLIMITYARPPGFGAKLDILQDRIEAYKPGWLHWPVLASLTAAGVLLFAALVYLSLRVLTRDLSLSGTLVVCALNLGTLAAIIAAW